MKRGGKDCYTHGREKGRHRVHTHDPLTYDEAVAALDAHEHTGRARVARRDEFDPVCDAYPGSEVPAYIMDSHGRLATVKLIWGYTLEGGRAAVYNTRIETALDQFRRGRHGMWANAIAQGRCLVPVRAFYESHGVETVPSEKTGKPVRRQHRFRVPCAGSFFLAGVQQEGQLSIVTTAPNASVAHVHDRMPLVLGPGESGVWLGPDFDRLADRSAIQLTAEPER